MPTDLKSLIGVHRDLPASEYHLLQGASASRLMKLWSSTPAHLKLQLSEGFEPTPSMIIGTLGHALVLEPDRQLPKVIVIPETYPTEEGDKKWSGNAKFCKTWIAERKQQGCIPLSKSDYDNALGAARALTTHPNVAPILTDCETELTLITWDQTNDVGVRCRLDIKPGSQFPFLADCKFTASVNERKFKKQIWDMGYHIQAALNLRVWNELNGSEDLKTGFKFFAVENKEPFDVRVFSLTPALIEKGWEAVIRLLPIYAQCERTGVWTGSSADEVECDVPAYA